MPIPTRSLSLREPRKQPSTLGRTATGRTASTSISSGPSNPPSSSGSDNGTKNKSLLPVRDDNRPTGSPVRIPKPQESRLPERGTRLVQKPTQQDPRPTEPTGLSRRQSLIRPSSLKPTSSARTPSVSTGSTTLTTPKRATFAQGPPSPSKSDAISNQNGRATSPKKTSMAPPPRPVRSTSLRQPASSSAGSGPGATARGHVRHRSQVTTVPGQVSRKLEPPSPSTTTPRSRATFTTYQQQFSPRKTTDKSTAAAAQPSGGSTEPDPSLISASWPEIASLQTELLQLSLLHRTSLQQDAQWRHQAEEQLRSKYDSVAARYRTMVVEEKEHQRRLNGLAVSGWLKNTREHNGQQGFGEQIRILSQVTQEVCDLNDSLAGRYTLAVQGFEAWFHKAREIKNYRLEQGGVVGHVVFIDPIDPAWKEEAYAMTMQLELCSRQLESLDILGYGEVERLENSALLRMARGLDEMVKLMVDELHAIRKIEADITSSERQWVSQLTRQFMTRRSQEKRPSGLGMWRQTSLKS